jgi:nucleoside-diphosphate-sugar epimerase
MPERTLPRAPGLVVVTGADGFIGRAVCGQWRVAGLPCRGLVRALTPATAASADFFPVGDLAALDAAALANALHGVRVVVHLAGRAHVMRETATDPLAVYRRANVHVTGRLARAAGAAGAAHFIFASTVKVNGDTTLPGRPFRENDPAHPRDDYAVSKWEAERLLADVARDTGMRVTVLRLPLVYGPGVKGNFARLIRAVARGVPLPLGAIDNRRSLLGLSNLGHALGLLCEDPTADRGRVTTYFLADAQAISTPDLVSAIASALGVAPRLVRAPLGMLRLAAACTGHPGVVERLAGSLEVDTRAFRTAFFWTPPHPLAEGLAETVAAFCGKRTAPPL